jgi:hypothetical protein
MTRTSLWMNAAPLAALSRHWAMSAGRGSVGEINVTGMPYANTFVRGRVPFAIDNLRWQIRLDERSLPFLTAAPNVNAFNSLIPILKITGGDSYSTITVNGREFVTEDFYEDVRLPFLGEPLTVFRGREKPCQRAQVRLVASVFFGLPDGDYTEISDDINGTARAIKRDFVFCHVMFMPRANGVTSWGGNYVCLRHVLPRAIVSSAGTVIDYKDLRLITCSLAEIGELSNGVLFPRDSILVPADNVSVDCGLAREVLSGQGTAFQCVLGFGGISVLQFPFVLSDVDAQLTARLSLIPNVFTSEETLATPLLSLGAFGRFTKAPYAGIGECPAFEIKHQADHARIVKLSHYTGAITTPPYHEFVEGGRQDVPSLPEWETWSHSLYPYTPHHHFVVSADGGVDLGDVDASRRRPTPIYGLQDVTRFSAQTIEMFPQRQAQVRASCIEGFSQSGFATPYADNAAYMLGKTPNNDMVIAGKRITGVTVRLDPYATEDIEEVRVGVEPIQKPAGGSVTLTHNAFDRSQSRWVNFEALDNDNLGDDLYWFKQSSAEIPAGATPVVTGQTALYNGFEIDNDVQAVDAYEIQGIPKGEVSGELEESVVLFQHAFTLVPFQIGEDGAPETIPGLFKFRDRTQYEPTPVRYAPFTGEYQMSRMQLGGIQTAGNWFHYNGTAEFSVSQAVEYKVYLRANTTAFEWQVDETNAGEVASIIDAGSTFDFYDVPITEEWELKADHVEFHAVLEVRLQEAGTFNPNFTFGFGDERDVLYASNEIFDQPRGRVRDIVTYTAGNEPRPAIFLKLYGRSVMRGSVSVSADTSNLPGEYPWSLSNTESPRVASMAGGVPGRFNGDTWETIDNNQSQFFVFEYQFNADQTEQLLNGQTVVATRWAEPGPSPNEPAAWVYGQGLALASKVSVSLAAQQMP